MSVTKPIILDETGLKIVDELEGIRRAVSGADTHKIYGVKRTLTSTSSAWERIDDSVGLTANATKDGSAVTNDFDNIYPWSDIITVNYDVANDKVVARLGDANFAFDGTNGEVMTYIPHFYIERIQDGTYETIRISEHMFDNAIEVPAFYIARYTTSDGVHSYSGVTSTVSTTIATFRTNAMDKGEGWHLLDWHYFVLEHLYLVEYANANSQSILGQGVCSVSAQIENGTLDSLGMKSGCLANAGATAVIYRGVENPFGNIWQLLDGINIIDNKAYVCFNHEKYQSDTTEEYTLVGQLATANGSPNKMCFNKDTSLIGMPSVVGTSTYGDYYWQATGNRIVLVGGNWNNGSYDGFFCFLCNNASSASWGVIGGRLIKESV